MRIIAGTKAVVLRFQTIGKQYSNQVHEATSMPVDSGPFEERTIQPGTEFEINDDTTRLISIGFLGEQTQPNAAADSPNGPGSE